MTIVTNTTHIWIVSDGKLGHINQSLGLVEALQRKIPGLTWQEVPIMKAWQAASYAWKQRQTKASPKFIVSAGHHTHFTLLILAKIMRVPAIVLMKPSLPLSWFDLCIIPEHDAPLARHNIIESIGPLNRMQPAKKDIESKLILVGGPSKHFSWNDEHVFAQVENVLQQDNGHWIIATSRRTPIKMVALLQELANVTVVLASETDANWLPSRLAKTENCWVTQDSISMIYEALTAGCSVKLLAVPCHHENRLILGLEKLQAAGYLGASSGSVLKLAEANRCVAIVRQRFLS
ncbi:MAG: hypothetical protein EXR38_03900 [Methylotenera sp.]|nr:hypothetical protein [Methylotenera sp.]